MGKTDNINRNNMKTAYKQIFNVSDADLKKPEHQKIMDSALEEVWSYSGLFEGEDEVLREQRLDIDTVKDGRPYDLANHFKNIKPELKSMSQWSVIFHMYNRMKAQSKDDSTSEVVKEPVEEQPVVDSVSDKITTKQNSISNNEKENTKMTNLDDVKAKMKMSMGGSRVNASPQIDAAARQAVEESKASREAGSRNTCCTKGVLGCRPLNERLVPTEDKTAPVGFIAEGKLLTIINNFKTKTGYDAETDTFTKLASGQEANARAMLAELQAAENDANHAFALNESKSLGTLKGFQMRLPDGSVVYRKMENVRTYLFNETLGGIHTAWSDGSVRLAKVTQRKGGKKSSDQVADDAKVQDLKFVAAIKTDQRGLMTANPTAFVVYHKEINKDKTSMQTGVRSELFVKYKTDTIKEGTTDVKLEKVYRIPLVANMYESKVTDADLEKEFGNGMSAAGGGAQKGLNLDSADDLNKIMTEFIAITAIAASTEIQSGDDSIITAVRANAATQTESDAREDAEDFT